MKSPFPGMDPYIEVSNLWGDFHDLLIAEIHRTLSLSLPPGYVARTGRRSYIILTESETRDDQPFIPDIKVTAPRRGKGTASPARPTHPPPTRATSELQPVTLRAFIEEQFEETFLDIYELEPERRLVTSIEVLSPSNKRRGSEGWKRYLRKRQVLLLGKANLVEIDLLRGGDRMPMLDPWPGSPYTLLVAREERAPRCHVWPAFFDRPLPAIPVPLARPDRDITLELQPLIDVIYERGRYREEIDYSQPLTPPLSAEQSAWFQQQMQREKPVGKTSTSSRRSRRSGK
jgi:hypothetical protein